MQLTHAMALLTLCSGLFAQTPTPAHRIADDGPEPGNNSRTPSIWGLDPILLVGTQRAAPQTFPGILGSFELAPSPLAVLPWQGGNALNVLDKLPAQLRGTVHYHVLNTSSKGPALSHRTSLPFNPIFRQEDSRQVCFERAQRRLAEVRGTEMAPGWENARVLDTAIEMYRPDVAGVAYYEFPVEPQGFLVVATGAHDFPVPHWNYAGEPIAAFLAREAGKRNETVARVYKLDALSYAAENAKGDLVANLGTMPYRLVGLPAVPAPLAFSDRPSSVRFTAWASWNEMKQEFAATYRPLILDLASQAAGLWQAERMTSSAGPQDWSAWTTYIAGASGDQRDYWQHTVSSCASGCGPVAWAMLFGWGDKNAHDGDAYWSGRTGLFRCGGTSTGSTSCVAPSTLDTDMANVVEEIRVDVSTFCITGSGATYPWDMDGAQNYLDPRTSTDLDTHYNSVGIHEDRLREYARDSIRDRDTPAVIGTGWLTHYPLAWKYRYRTRVILWVTEYDREFYVNNGWYGTSGDGWVSAGTWFAGEIYP